MDVAVQFSTVDEFLEELERDLAPGSDRVVVRGIVRLGNQHDPFIGGRRCYVRASYVSDQAVIGIRRSVQLVELVEYVGSVMGVQDADERTLERLESVATAVRQTCERLNLECRDGMYRAVA